MCFAILAHTVQFGTTANTITFPNNGDYLSLLFGASEVKYVRTSATSADSCAMRATSSLTSLG